MIESRLAYLFQVYFSKKATPKERDELMGLLLQSENDEQLKLLLTETWQGFDSQEQLFSGEKGAEMLSGILNNNKFTYPFPEIKERRFNWFTIAAAAAVLCFIMAGAYVWLKPNQAAQPTALIIKKAADAVKGAIVPGGNKAILTLSNGSTIILDSSQEGTLAKQGNAKVIKLNTATLAYNTADENNGEIVYNTLSTPSGGQYQLILQDGTKVWLNASSSIHFPTIFKGKERSVTITGEAYFEVAKNAALPFKINVDKMEIKVLGTHFNIMAYGDENSVNTTLLEGSVKVSRGSLIKMLTPGQESRINKTGDIKIVDAEIEEVMAWKNGWFQFNGYDIEKVMRQISRWYNVEIVYEGKIPSGHFSGIVNRENDISQVLKIMQAGGVRFKIVGRRVTVLQ